MVGKYHIEIYSNKLKYEFDIKRNLTVIRGNSATGKSQLIRMLNEYSEFGQDSGITLICDKECVVLSGRRWQDLLNTIHDAIIFIDEGNEFIKSQEFAEAVRGSSNYFVLITREKLSMLPYSIREIYGMREHGKYPVLTPVYNELYPLYSAEEQSFCSCPDVVITEDEKAGFQFFKNSVLDGERDVIASGGKSKILNKMLPYLKKKSKVLAIVDGAAFGSEMEETIDFIRFHENFFLYAPESFEWLILRSGIISVPANRLEKTYDYADSIHFMSWEQYYTELLRSETRNTIFQYSKERLNFVYLSETNKNKILSVMEEKIQFS